VTEADGALLAAAFGDGVAECRGLAGASGVLPIPGRRWSCWGSGVR